VGVSAKHHIERKKPMPYVNHYSCHILDSDWGHLTIKISGHPPFPAQVILNGHEYVACQAHKAGASPRGAYNPEPIDVHCQTIQVAMQGVFHELGLAA
jgi:hypothetical protein